MMLIQKSALKLEWSNHDRTRQLLPHCTCNHKRDSGGFKPPLNMPAKNSDYAMVAHKLSATYVLNSCEASESNGLSLVSQFYWTRETPILQFGNPSELQW